MLMIGAVKALLTACFLHLFLDANGYPIVNDWTMENGDEPFDRDLSEDSYLDREDVDSTKPPRRLLHY